MLSFGIFGVMFTMVFVLDRVIKHNYTVRRSQAANIITGGLSCQTIWEKTYLSSALA